MNKYTRGTVGQHHILKVQANPNFRSPAHPQTVSYPAKQGFAVQERSGVLRATNLGGASLNLSLRKDGSYFYHILTAIRYQVSQASTPAQAIPFQAALNRLLATESLKKGKVEPVPIGVGRPTHPLAGNSHLAVGASLFTQVNAGNQKLFQDGRGLHAFQDRVPGDVRGPEATRRVIPYHGTNLKQTNVHKPQGYSTARITRGRGGF